MKIWILSLALPLSALAAKEDLVTCQLKDMKTCAACEKRIPASCENHAFNGSLETQIKPRKIQWLVSNSKAGSEKIITLENSKFSLKDFQSSKDLKSLAQKMKLKFDREETVTLQAVQLAPNTALYKEQTGTAIAAQMKPQSTLRNVASTQDPIAGGVKRAQAQNKK